MPINVRPWFLWFDGSTDTRHALQGEDPVNSQYVPIGVKNIRNRTNSVNNQSYQVGDIPVVPRGSKEIIWSSEGYTNPQGVAVPALTANQKKATGLHTANAGAGALDLSPFKAVNLVVALASFTGGASPTFQVELDLQDDAAAPNTIALFQSAAVTAATKWWTSAGQSLIFPQAAAAPSLAAAGFTPFAAVTGWTIETIGLPLLPNGQIQWTIANAPTAVAWTAFLYGV